MDKMDVLCVMLVNRDIIEENFQDLYVLEHTQDSKSNAKSNNHRHYGTYSYDESMMITVCQQQRLAVLSKFLILTSGSI